MRAPTTAVGAPDGWAAWGGAPWDAAYTEVSSSLTDVRWVIQRLHYRLLAMEDFVVDIVRERQAAEYSARIRRETQAYLLSQPEFEELA